MARRLASILSAFAFACGSVIAADRVPALSRDYFPPGIFSAFETDQWFGPYLRSLDQPSLFQLARESRDSVFRISVFPPFGAYLALTLYIQPDGTGRLTLKKAAQITITDGYGPGPVLRRATFLLTRGAVRRFERSLEEIHFWNLATTRPNSVLDANAFLYEAAKQGRYHVIQVIDPGSPTLLSPARFLLRVAGESMPE